MRPRQGGAFSFKANALAPQIYYRISPNVTNFSHRLLPLRVQLDALRDACPENPVFIHLFSNGGVHKCAHLLRAYKETTGEALPVSSMLLDSAPGVATAESGMKALSFQLPENPILRLFGKAALWLFLNGIQIIATLARIPNPMDVARAMINDRSLFKPSAKKGLIRCYIYSDNDTIVKPHEVEEHIKDSEAAGIVVRKEKFHDTPHITHMIMDPDRYWGIV
ncbi:hypothetical protein N7468_004029 [Penicillium chermesinum]|uniref:Indole-diterpene biosynthesis protein PaxU n=1 Tax=Penicillium chermesinum TaxID=63820 RepID=A0A9W9TS62_9EURO|nr:uncharacterized protein N7468_004029 [Penicillium chermesinum]KAJ5239410.1 hypothetical protein N7468_004029 [Penicillium chermesinum]